MRRKKKKEEEPTIYHTPFESTAIPPYPEMDLSPYTIETTSLSDNTRRFITTTHPGTSVTYTGINHSYQHDYIANHYGKFDNTVNHHFDWSWEQTMKILGKEEDLKVDMKTINTKDTYIISCSNSYDLSPEQILHTLSAMKGKLMFEIIPNGLKELRCETTSQVKQNIIIASKKLKMYGKKIPIIASFDEFGNRLPDQIKIGDDDHGVTLVILDSEHDFFKMTAIKKVIEPAYKPPYDKIFEEDLPF